MKTKRLKPPKHDKHSDYWKIWRIVDGAVRDCFYHHSDYLTDKGHKQAQLSIVKRVTGKLHGVEKEFSSREGRSIRVQPGD